MKRAVCLTIALSAVAILAHAKEDTFGVGKLAPNVVLQFVDGKYADLSNWLGKKPIYLKMWATWCKPCREEMPHLQSAFEQYGDNIAVIGINAGFNDTVEEVEAFQLQHNLTLPMAIDLNGDVGQTVNLIATPYHVLIDRAGTVIHAGHAANAELDEKLRALSKSSSGSNQEFHDRTRAAPTKPRLIKAGDLAPDFTIETIDGSEFVLSSVRDEEPVYLLFFTTWCESYLAGDGNDPEAAAECQRTQDAIASAYAESVKPIRLIGIASRLWTGPDELRSYASTFHPKYPVALDATNEVFHAYGVRQFPTLITVVNGRVASRHEGGLVALPKQ